MDKSIEQMGQDLAFAGYVKSTRDKYVRTVEQLAVFYGRPVSEIRREELRAYLEHLSGRARSASWLKMQFAAIVFLYRKTLGRPNDISFVCWPKQHSPLPEVLSLGEVHAMLGALTHPMYQAIAM